MECASRTLHSFEDVSSFFVLDYCSYNDARDWRKRERERERWIKKRGG
jgi:hypothetical protein